MSTPLYHAWKQAHSAASAAENELFLLAMAHARQPRASPKPPPELVEDAARKRVKAQAAFAAFLAEVDSLASSIRHSLGNVDFALRVARHVADAPLHVGK